jgi:hypothetical protein
MFSALISMHVTMANCLSFICVTGSVPQRGRVVKDGSFPFAVQGQTWQRDLNESNMKNLGNHSGVGKNGLCPAPE